MPVKPPIPNHLNGCQAAVKLQVACRVLLRPSTPTNSSSIEGLKKWCQLCHPEIIANETYQISNKTTRPVLGKDSHGSCRFIIRGFGHVEDQVLQRSCLRHLPMNTSGNQGLVIVGRGDGHLRQVKDEVPDLTEELVLVDVPVLAAPIWRSVHVLGAKSQRYQHTLREYTDQHRRGQFL